MSKSNSRAPVQRWIPFGLGPVQQSKTESSADSLGFESVPQLHTLDIRMLLAQSEGIPTWLEQCLERLDTQDNTTMLSSGSRSLVRFHD